MTPNPDALSEILSNQTFHQNHQNIEFSKMSFLTRRWWPNDVNESNKKVSKHSCSEKSVFSDSSSTEIFRTKIGDHFWPRTRFDIPNNRTFRTIVYSPWPPMSFMSLRWFCARTTFSLLFSYLNKNMLQSITGSTLTKSVHFTRTFFFAND